MRAPSPLLPMCLPTCAAARGPIIPRRPRNGSRARSNNVRRYNHAAVHIEATDKLSLPWPVPKDLDAEVWPALPMLAQDPYGGVQLGTGQPQDETVASQPQNQAAQETAVPLFPKPPELPKAWLPPRRATASPTPTTETQAEPNALFHRALRRPNTAPTNKVIMNGRPLPWTSSSGASTARPTSVGGRKDRKSEPKRHRAGSGSPRRPSQSSSTADASEPSTEKLKFGKVTSTSMRRATKAAKPKGLADKRRKEVDELRALAANASAQMTALAPGENFGLADASDLASSMIATSNTIAQDRSTVGGVSEVETLLRAEKEDANKGVVSEAAQRDREKARATAFKRCADDGEIHRDRLFEAIQMIGFPRPQQSWINWVLKDSETHYSTLSLPEFQEFVRGYEQKQREQFAAEFKKFDTDDSGQVDTKELSMILASLGITPLPATLATTISEVDADGTGQLDVGEFEHVLELLWVREGFTKEEVDELDRVFKKFDRDNSGEVSSHELMGILSWLGYPAQQDVVDQIAKEVDADGSGQLCWSEFIACMRRFREREVQRVKSLMSAFDSDGSGTVDRDGGELTNLLAELGYSGAPDAINEAAADANITAHQLNFDDLWLLLQAYRGRSGFTHAEEALLRHAFTRYDYTEDGQISTLEVGKAMRLLGSAVTIEVQRKLVAAVDVDHSGFLDFSEFRTLMMMRRQTELKELSEVFNLYLGSETKLTADSGHLQRALRKVGCSENDILASEKEVTFFGFVKIVDRVRTAVRERMRQHAGFNDLEVTEYKIRFRAYDNDGSGDIGGAELRELLGEILPAASFSMKHRARLEKLLKEADEDGNGTLDFGDFLRLMRHHHDDCDREELEKINKTIAETAFSDEEAQQFRTIFEQMDTEATGHISMGDVQKMLNGVCTLQRQHISELANIFNDVTPGADANWEIDFPDFLRVLRRVLDIDLAGIKTSTQPQKD